MSAGRGSLRVPTEDRIAVFAEGLGKHYPLWRRPLDRLVEAIFRRPRHRAFVALADVSFEVPRGQGFGLIGENGAGKSTLLKILAGVTAPTTGRFSAQRPLASILELGSAFHGELTGRQNIALNAALLGLSAAETRARTPEIIAWSELGDFIDRPVKTYSSGMVMRLGFSIAVQVEPAVLIVDEALSVGDGYFQKKCVDKLQAFLARGGTLLFCSHAMYYVSAFCEQALWLRQGRVAALGPTVEVVQQYENYLVAKSSSSETEARPEEVASGPARLTAVTPLREGGAYRPREAFELEIEWETADESLGFHLGVGIDRVDGVQIFSFASHRSHTPAWRNRGRHRARLVVPALPLMKGCFTIYVYLLDEDGLHPFDRRILHSALVIETTEYTIGLLQTEHRWLDESASGSTLGDDDHLFEETERRAGRSSGE